MTTSSVTIEDTVTGSIETVPSWKVGEHIAAWYLGSVPEVLEVAIEQLQASINRGESFEAPATYLGVRVTVAQSAREISAEWAAKRQEVCDDRELGFINSWTCADRLEELRAHYQPLLRDDSPENPGRRHWLY